jgi:hypothetical protein
MITEAYLLSYGGRAERSSSDLLVFSDTGTVLAMGLANLIFGTISFFHKVSSNFFHFVGVLLTLVFLIV